MCTVGDRLEESARRGHSIRGYMTIIVRTQCLLLSLHFPSHMFGKHLASQLNANALVRCSKGIKVTYEKRAFCQHCYPYNSSPPHSHDAMCTPLPTSVLLCALRRSEELLACMCCCQSSGSHYKDILRMCALCVVGNLQRYEHFRLAKSRALR